MDKERDFDNYNVQLVERMRESSQNLPDPNEMSEYDEGLPEELKMFAYTEQYIWEKAKEISVIDGIDTEAFPPLNKMTDAQTVFLF